LKQKNNIIIFLMILFSFSARAEKLNFFMVESANIVSSIHVDSLSFLQTDSVYFKPVKHKRLKAILLALFLGNFGAHRLYLGTSPKVVVGYSFTLGGIFILPVVDAVMLLTVKDISLFENNQNFFMFKPK